MGLISRVSSRTYRSSCVAPLLFYFLFFLIHVLLQVQELIMLIYRDYVSGDEVCSDSFPMKLLYNDVIMEVDAANIRIDGGIDDSLIGGNASADGEDADAGADDSAVTGINVIINHKLNPTQFTKKDFKKDGLEAFKKIFGSFKDWDLYIGESMNPDG